MNHKLIFVSVLMFSGSALAEDRPSMTDSGTGRPSMTDSGTGRPSMVDNSGQLDLEGCIRSAENAANSENLEGFLNCFVPEVREKIRRPMALRFVQYNVSMEIEDCHVVVQEEEVGELAVKYKLKLDDQTKEITSCILLVKCEEGVWRMKGEKIMLQKDTSPVFVQRAQQAQAIDFGNGAQVMFDPKEADYPADIGRHTMGGCANGRCNIR